MRTATATWFAAARPSAILQKWPIEMRFCLQAKSFSTAYICGIIQIHQPTNSSL
jgi:hypothetical protein